MRRTCSDMTLHITQADTTAQEETLGLLSRAFARSRDPAAIADRRRHFSDMIARDPWFRSPVQWVRWVEGRMAASLHVFRRRVFCRGRVLRVGSIGAVACDPEFQGRGFASRLLEHVRAWLRDEGFDLSFIYGAVGFYSRVGWVAFPGARLRVDLDEAAHPPERIEVEEVRDSTGLEAVIALDSDHADGDRLASLRTSRHWRRWLEWLTTPPRRLLLVRHAGAPVGFLRARVADAGTALLEIGCHGVEALGHCVAAMSAESVRSGAGPVQVGSVLPDFAGLAFLDAHGVSYELAPPAGPLVLAPQAALGDESQRAALRDLLPASERLCLPASADHF